MFTARVDTSKEPATIQLPTSIINALGWRNQEELQATVRIDSYTSIFNAIEFHAIRQQESKP